MGTSTPTVRWVSHLKVEQLLTKVCHLFGGGGTEWDEDSEVFTLADELSQRLRAMGGVSVREVNVSVGEINVKGDLGASEALEARLNSAGTATAEGVGEINTFAVAPKPRPLPDRR